ncbi:MAG TPA: VOC family protein [Gaiellaceae bacterium]|jgi:catechol 2,3-dioxygenase-like lactoylglutathione lyase family enzyme|nr:VOC family protein [Gaiellaceae bacterium]
MEIDHLTVFVQDYDASKPFYEDALAPLGLVPLLDWRDRRRTYFGRPGEPSSLWLIESDLGGRLEIALPARDAGAVHSFYGTAIAAGARSDWEPGIRPEYSTEYYSARVHDFDGNSIEAVFRGAAAQAAA